CVSAPSLLYLHCMMVRFDLLSVCLSLFFRVFFLPYFFFFYNDTATTEIYTLSLHDALPICWPRRLASAVRDHPSCDTAEGDAERSEEHTSELQSPDHLVCRLLLEKKKKIKITNTKEHNIT